MSKTAKNNGDDIYGTKKESEEISDIIHLPVGIEKDGVRYKEVQITEMTGIDDHLISGKQSGGNAGKGISLVICRCIQAVPGLLEQKTNPASMFDRELARRMTQPDRDFITVKVNMLGGGEVGIMAGKCPRCNLTHEEEITLGEIPFVDWPSDKPTELPFQLKTGIFAKTFGEEKAKWHTEGTIRFPIGKEQELVSGMGENEIASAVDSTLAACITRLGDLTSLNTTQTQAMTSMDRRYLMRLLQREMPGLILWKEFKCGCGREYDLRLDVAAFFDGRQR